MAMARGKKLSPKLMLLDITNYIVECKGDAGNDVILYFNTV